MYMYTLAIFLPLYMTNVSLALVPGHDDFTGGNWIPVPGPDVRVKIVLLPSFGPIHISGALLRLVSTFYQNNIYG